MITSTYEYVKNFWTTFSSSIDVVKEYVACTTEHPADKFRNAKGGNVLFRPIGLIEFVKASIAIAKVKSTTPQEVIASLAMVPLDLSEAPWNGILWDGKKIINRVNVTLIRYFFMLYYDDALLDTETMKSFAQLYISATGFKGDEKKATEKIISSMKTHR